MPPIALEDLRAAPPARVIVSHHHDRNGAPYVVVALEGELDVAALGVLARRFDTAVDRSPGNVVVDLARVQFIGAAWIGRLVRSHAAAAGQGRGLILRSPPATMARVLDLCGLSYLVEPRRGRAFGN